ncbi:HNH endonuclease, partial [Enterobacter cloacae]|uniref:HNH endonuclease n=1 Tax=Enterobacter cloacae TaxID=550 RepID=UPI0031DA84E5
RLIRCVCGKKIGPDPRNFNQRVSLGRNDLLIRTFPKKAAIEVKNGLSYPRSKSVSKNALNKADYKCEINCDHPTFRRRNSPLNYTEPHHIVPMSKQDYFENSLDVEENIISLCCNCHKQIHLGKGFEDMLRKIYAERKDVLKKAGIEILLEDLILFYKMEGN